MRKQSYLDIFPSTGIANTINSQDLETPVALQELYTDIATYITNVEQENVKYLNARETGQISASDTYRFFRSQERTRNVRLILQYLVTFLDGLPLQSDIDPDVVNPFLQIKTFARNLINLLKEPDVIDIILREHKQLGLLNESNTWYYRGQISKNHKQIIELIDQREIASIRGYCQVFEALNRLCLFWFSVRNENMKRVRRSDIYIYKLTLILLNRHFITD